MKIIEKCSKQKPSLFSTLVIITLLGVSFALSANEISSIEGGSLFTFQDSTDIPTWVIGDKWVYEADIYSDTENGVFDVTSNDLSFTVENITTIVHNGISEKIYVVNISGTISGTIQSSILSGDVTGEIIGNASVRQADLSMLDSNITSSGIIQYFIIFESDFFIRNSAKYYPRFEYFDFPIKTNEVWNISGTAHQQSTFYVEDFYPEETSEGNSSMEGYAECLSVETIQVPAGTFNCFHLMSENNGSIESWYATEIKNVAKMYMINENGNEINRVWMNLSSYTLNAQDVTISASYSSSTVNVSEPVTISGYVQNASDETPVVYTNVTIHIPYVNTSFVTTTDHEGFFSYTFIAPLLLDPTNTTYDIGSDGVILSVDTGTFSGYTVLTLTVIGITIDDVNALPENQYQTLDVTITCMIYSVEDIVSKTVSITGPQGFEAINESLQNASKDNYYYKHSYQIPGNYSFYIWAQDTLGNKNKSTMYNFTIVPDLIPPSIQNGTIQPNPQYANNRVNISCVITDNVAVDQAQVIITDPLGVTSNVSLSHDENTYWYASTYTIIGNYSIIIWTNDTLGNSNESIPQTLTIVSDEYPPMIQDDTHSIGYCNESFLFNATITDNAEVSTAWVTYWFDMQSSQNETMVYEGNNRWLKTIIIPPSVDQLYYVISANDTSNNWNNTEVNTVFLYDYVSSIIDVNQSEFDRGFRMMPGWDAYQEFIPSMDVLSSIELYMTKSGSPTGDVTIQIRQDNADGAIVFEEVISPDDVLTSFPTYIWVNVDLGAVPVTSGNTYVIVLLSPADGAGTHHNLQWGWCDSYPANSGGPYDGGWFYFRKDFSPSWSFVRDWDFTFRMYGFM